uniref:Uncharacterized protein n=1 Tax=Rhodnius prolixus TaxID=13249 RepID=T1HWY5_RHOPR
MSEWILLTNVVVKRALAAAQCVFIIDDRIQSTPIQSVVDVKKRFHHPLA